MLASASRLPGALWSWTREQAGIARQPATADRNSGRTIVRTTLAASLTSVVYATFGTIVWSAYDQFGHQSPRNVTPRVVAGAAPVKLAPARPTVRGSETDRPLVVEAFAPWVDDELSPQLATALLEDGADDAREPASLSTPARARSIARAASAVRPAVAPEDAGPEPAIARAEARLEARSHPGAGPFRHEPAASPEVLSALRPSEGLDTPRPVPGVESTSPRPSAVPAKPEATTPLPPLPWLKPTDFAAAWASADRAFSSQGDGRTNAAAAGSGAESRPPPQPAFKPLEAGRILASGEPLRMATAAAEPASGLRSFWSSLMALFAPAPRRLLIAGNGGGREANAGRGLADGPSRAGADPAGPSPGNGSGRGTDGASPGGGNTTGDTTNRGSTGGNTGSADNNANQGSDQGRGGRGGDDDDDDDGGRGGGDDDGGGRGRGGGDDDGGSGGGKGGGDKGGGDKGGGGKGGGDKGGGGKGGSKGGGGDDD